MQTDRLEKCVGPRGLLEMEVIGVPFSAWTDDAAEDVRARDAIYACFQECVATFGIVIARVVRDGQSRLIEMRIAGCAGSVLVARLLFPFDATEVERVA